MLLVKPSPEIYRSLERNEVAFGEEGGGRSDSHSGQRSGSGGGGGTTISITARTPVARPVRRQRRPPAGAEAAAAERRGGAAGVATARSRRVHASPHFQSNSGAFHTPARGWGLREQPRSQPLSSQRSLPNLCGFSVPPCHRLRPLGECWNPPCRGSCNWALEDLAFSRAAP